MLRCFPENYVHSHNTEKWDTASSKLQNRRLSSSSSENNDYCIVGGSFAYILMANSIFGMAPLRFRSHGKGFKISVSKPMCIYSHILVFFFGSIALFGKVIQLSLDENMTSESSAKLTQLVFLYFHFTITVSAVTGVTGGPKRMKNLITYLNKIAKVDISLSTQYSRLKEFKMFTTAVFFFILLNGLILNSSYSSIRRNGWFQIAVKFALHSLLFMEMNMYTQLVYFFVTIRNRFQSINDALVLVTTPWSAEFANFAPEPVNICVIQEYDTITNRVIITRDSIPNYPRLMVVPSAAMQRIAILRGSLCDIIKSINRDCGISIVIALLSTLGNVIVPLYFLVFVLSTPDPQEKTLGIFINCLWFTLHTSVMIFLINPCYNTIREDKKTKRLLCHLMSLAPARLFSLLEMFGYQVMLKTASYEPLNMCTLNRTLMVTILGAVSTYLVILIKF